MVVGKQVLRLSIEIAEIEEASKGRLKLIHSLEFIFIYRKLGKYTDRKSKIMHFFLLLHFISDELNVI